MGEKPLRLFVGVALAEALRAELEAYLAATFGARLPGRAVPPRNWHLTLRFLGATDAERHHCIVDELSAIEPPSAFDLELASLGAFPRPARAKVLWIGAGAGGDALRALGASVEAAAVRAGFAPERKPFSPHLTLSRLDPPADVRAALDAPPFGGRMRVDEFVLFRSHLGGGPPRYEPLERFPLAP
ncbi:MAG TPA: RNA 2',3'-cyclic phosphodiesterase [Longimicrobiaceae bacterium]|nr:RNA 2',3'-cyclic phosphodiesterase [Longimicrobiaceae bacterium]